MDGTEEVLYCWKFCIIG